MWKFLLGGAVLSYSITALILNLNMWAVISGIIMIGLFVYLLYIEKKKEKEYQSLINEIQILKENRVQFNEVFQHLRKERHDYIKHITAIQFMLEQGNMEEARGYIQLISQNYEETSIAIKGEKGAVAAILHNGYHRCMQENISIYYDFSTPISKLPLRDDKLVLFIGNLIDNAIDAAIEARNQNGYGDVHISLIQRAGLFILSCENATIPLPNEVVDRLFEQSTVTTKANHAGLGTTIIKEIVEEYGGHLQFEHQNGRFELKIKLPIVTH